MFDVLWTEIRQIVNAHLVPALWCLSVQLLPNVCGCMFSLSSVTMLWPWPHPWVLLTLLCPSPIWPWTCKCDFIFLWRSVFFLFLSNPLVWGILFRYIHMQAFFFSFINFKTMFKYMFYFYRSFWYACTICYVVACSICVQYLSKTSVCPISKKPMSDYYYYLPSLSVSVLDSNSGHSSSVYILCNSSSILCVQVPLCVCGCVNALRIVYVQGFALYKIIL